MLKIYSFTVFLVICVSFILSCSSVPVIKYDECVKPYMKNYYIRWGECIKEHDAMKGFELRADGTIRQYSGLQDSSFVVVGKTESSNFCKFYKMLNDTITKIPTLNAPGNFNRFIEFHNPSKKYYFRAIWNIDYKTYGSYCYRVIFDSLDVMLKEAKQNLDK